ncbi:MAG: NAD(P)/FAD-dependent oxidoreductase [bacterium]
MKTVAVIGGGASGMAAGLAARERGARVLLFERQERVGRKLMSTGNGRCNLTNQRLTPANFHSLAGDAIPALPGLYDTAETLRFFRGLGLLTVAEPGGRVYPLSDQAGSVVDVLRLALGAAGAEVHTAEEVRSLRRGFAIVTDNGSYRADRVIIACGGLASEKLGATKSGYQLLAALGHSCTRLCPSLVQLKTDTTFIRALKGVRAEAGLRLVRGGKIAAEGRGEVQFTDYGLSGPAIFDLSRAATTARGECELLLDLLPDYGEEEIAVFLRRRCQGSPALTTENLTTGLLHNRLGRTLTRYAGLDLVTPLSRVEEEQLLRLARAMKRFAVTVTGDMGLPNAQVTAGGVPLSEFDPATLESRLVPGLFACGEVLDVDGDCGGYNLQWAWASGRLAGRSAALC